MQAIEVFHSYSNACHYASGGAFLELTDEDLKDIGIANKFHRRQIKHHIKELEKVNLVAA